MPTSMQLSLTDELKAFVDQQSGEGTLYTTSAEYIRALIRERQERLEAARFRQSVLAGYQDILDGRTTEYKGSIRDVIKQAKARSQLT